MDEVYRDKDVLFPTEYGGYMTAGLAEMVLESSHDGIFITDGQANVLYINKSYESISGLKREDMFGRNMRELVNEGIISASGTLQVLGSGRPVTMEQTFRTGKRAVITSTPAFGEDGRAVLVVTNVRDITELHMVKKELQRKESLNRRYFKELESIRQELTGGENIVAEDKTMLSILRLAKRVAHVDSPLLLTGESGCGKRRLAKYIHAGSERKKGPFLVCDLENLSQDSMEAELFGSAGGEQLGMLELADGGTIYIGGVQLLPMAAQARLARFLSGGEPGEKRPDARVIAASSHSAEELISRRMLKDDLYYSLSIFAIAIPPLRERRDDILPLAELFLSEINQQFGADKCFSQAARERLLTYDWPGNVQELRNSVQRAVIISEDRAIGGEDLFIGASVAAVRAHFEELPEQVDLKEILEQVELSYMNRAFEKYGSTRAAAKSLGMDASTFVRKRQKYIKAGLLQNRNE